MVKHVLKNGQTVQDITGHVVKQEDVPSAYALLGQGKKETENESKHC